MDDLDSLKQQWQQLSARTRQLEETNRRLAEKLAGSKTTSLQQRLAARISRMGWGGLVLPALAPLLYYEFSMPVWVAVCYALFGLVMSSLSFWFAEFIRAENLTEMPVSDAISRATKIKELQAQLRTFGSITAIALVTSMAFMIPEGPDRQPIIVGGSIGLVIGLAIGIRRCIINARLAREIIKSVN